MHLRFIFTFIFFESLLHIRYIFHFFIIFSRSCASMLAIIKQLSSEARLSFRVDSLCRLESQVLLLTFKQARFLARKPYTKSREPFFDFSQQVKADAFHYTCERFFPPFIFYMLSDSVSRNELAFKDSRSSQFSHLGLGSKTSFPRKNLLEIYNIYWPCLHRAVDMRIKYYTGQSKQFL